LVPVIGFENTPGFVRITGTDFDKEGNMYAVGSNAHTAAYKKARGGAWTAIDLEYEGFGFQENTGEILANSAGQLLLLKKVIEFY
jgi:hypothetical protein